jgi:RNA polymerase sigma-70 factor (ECF subfamily)
MTSPGAQDDDLSSARPRFEQLYEDHFQAIYAFVLRRCHSQDVGDIVADVFAVAWRRMAEVPEPPEDKLWLYGVARRVLSQNERASLRRLSLVTRIAQFHQPSVDSSAHDHPDPAARLRELISQLKELDQEIVRLRAWDGLSHAEIAELLGCSINKVTIRWHRAIKRLRKAMEAAPSAGLDGRPRSAKEVAHDD